MIPMEEISTITKPVAEYGVLILITAIFLYVCIRLINLFFKFLEKRVGEKKVKSVLIGAAKYELMMSQNTFRFLGIMPHFLKGKSIGCITTKRVNSTNYGYSYPCRAMTALLSVVDM